MDEPETAFPLTAKTRFRIRKVLVTGNKRTREDILRSCLAPITTAKTWEEVQLRTLEANRELQRLGIFKSVRFLLDDATEAGSPQPGSCDLRVDLTEPRWPISLDIKTTTNMALQPEMEGNIHIRNFFGRAEALSLHAHVGTDLSKSAHWAPGLRLSFTKPLLNHGRESQFNCEAYVGSQWHQHSSLKEAARGVTCSFINGRHQFGYELAWRTVQPFSSAPPMTRLLAGHSIKSSLKHSWSLDKRNNPILPTKGYAIETTEELAGLGGDVKFFKQELNGQIHIPIPLWKDAALACVVKAGHLWPLFGDQSRSVDRFFLGGTTSLRGFQYNTVGPSQQGRALGGNIFGSASLHLTAPLPIKDLDVVRSHAFVQTGSLTSYNWGAGLGKNFEDFLSAGRASAGVGLVFGTPVGRIEFNVCYPLRKQASDFVDTCQLAITMKFS